MVQLLAQRGLFCLSFWLSSSRWVALATEQLAYYQARHLPADNQPRHPRIRPDSMSRDGRHEFQVNEVVTVASWRLDAGFLQVLLPGYLETVYPDSYVAYLDPAHLYMPVDGSLLEWRPLRDNIWWNNRHRVSPDQFYIRVNGNGDIGDLGPHERALVDIFYARASPTGSS